MLATSKRVTQTLQRHQQSKQQQQRVGPQALAGAEDIKKNKTMRSGFKMKGMDFGNSPMKQKVDLTKKTGLGPRAGKKPKKITSQDEEQAYENAQNDFNTDNPTKAQLAKALKTIRDERSREANKQERIEDARGK